MQINPMIRNNICLNSHPKGCAEATRAQIRYVRKEMSDGPVPAGIPKLVRPAGTTISPSIRKPRRRDWRH